MAKSSNKVEDYWREHQVESLFKELTQILVRRMPSDPVMAIVEHLQKKFPKSFRTDASFAKTPRQSVTSPQSDLQSEGLTDRRASSQSQISGIVAIPSVNSAFTNLLNPNTGTSQPRPELNFKHLLFANRVGNQAVKLGKDIRSDRDILEEEVIKPVDSKPSTTQTMPDNLSAMETHEEPTVLQLIKYKQQIHDEKDRREHREKLAELARQQREKEQLVQSDAPIRAQGIHDEHFLGQEDSAVAEPSAEQGRKSSHKPLVKSAEEEEILNDENVFQPHKSRERTRQKTPRLTSTQPLTGKPNGENPTCQFCGHALRREELQHSALPAAQVYQPQPSTQSIETTNSAGLDDWFESASDVSAPQHSNPRAADDVTPPPTGSSTFRRSLFQAINDHAEDRPPIVDSNERETKNKRTMTPRLSETGVFSRSPVSKKQQTSD